MKKLLAIMVLGLLFSGNTYAYNKENKLSYKILNEYFKDMSVANIMEMVQPNSLHKITTNEKGIQYHFFIRMSDMSNIFPDAKITFNEIKKKVYNETDNIRNFGKVMPVICFINSETTNCRVP